MWYFSVGGAKSIVDSDTGGPKSLLLGKFTMLSLLLLPPRGGQTPLPTSMGGPCPDLPLWIRHWASVVLLHLVDDSRLCLSGQDGRLFPERVGFAIVNRVRI